MRKNVPNNGQSIAEDITSNARNFLPVHLVRSGTWLYVWYVLVRGCTFGTFWYVYVRFGTFWYVLVRFDTSAYRVGFFDMKLSLEGNTVGEWGNQGLRRKHATCKDAFSL
jgi:hypothetical protein